MTLFGLTFAFFLIINPIGNAPGIAAVVRQFDLERQKRILVRELLFALAIAFFFLFLGERFLDLLDLGTYSISICGGILLAITAFDLIFPIAGLTHGGGDDVGHQQREPSFVPIATPLLFGPCFMTSLLVLAYMEPYTGVLALAVFFAWVGTAIVVMSAPYLQAIFGKRGIVMLEQFMGMILCFIAIQMMVDGIQLFRATL